MVLGKLHFGTRADAGRLGWGKRWVLQQDQDRGFVSKMGFVGVLVFALFRERVRAQHKAGKRWDVQEMDGGEEVEKKGGGYLPAFFWECCVYIWHRIDLHTELQQGAKQKRKRSTRLVTFISSYRRMDGGEVEKKGGGYKCVAWGFFRVDLQKNCKTQSKEGVNKLRKGLF